MCDYHKKDYCKIKCCNKYGTEPQSAKYNHGAYYDKCKKMYEYTNCCKCQCCDKNPCVKDCNPCENYCNPCEPKCNSCEPKCNPCVKDCNPCVKDCDPCVKDYNPCEKDCSLCKTDSNNEDLIELSGSEIYELKNATCTVTGIFEYTVPTFDIFYREGSGFIIKHCCQYYVVTCAHIVESDPDLMALIKIYVDVQNVNGNSVHRQIQCVLVGMDKAADIAVLRPLTLAESPADGYNLTSHPYLCFGDSTETAIGEQCFIIGNALGADPFSIADGVVRDNKFVLNLATETMLISAPSWNGNSGSPILNNYGKVIGMVCYVFSTEDIGFGSTLISTMAGGPTQFMMEKIVCRIIHSGDYTAKGFMGIIDFAPVSDSVLASLRLMHLDFLNGEYDILKGIYVKDIESGGPVESALPQPVKVGDIVTKIKDLATGKQLCIGNLDNQYHPSRITWFKKILDKVELTVVDPVANEKFTTIVTLATYPPVYDTTLGGGGARAISHENGNKTVTKAINGKKYKISTMMTKGDKNILS
jgi:S1-C subfamily serine protease